MQDVHFRNKGFLWLNLFADNKTARLYRIIHRFYCVNSKLSRLLAEYVVNVCYRVAKLKVIFRT